MNAPCWIGELPFLTMTGQVPIIGHQHVELVNRTGVQGTARWLTGVRGEPFTIHTAQDTETYLDALNASAIYQVLAGSDPVRLVWNYADFDLTSNRFVVLKVTPTVVRAQVGAIGGLYPPSTGWIEADWEMVAVEFVQEDD